MRVTNKVKVRLSNVLLYHLWHSYNVLIPYC